MKNSELKQFKELSFSKDISECISKVNNFIVGEIYLIGH